MAENDGDAFRYIEAHLSHQSTQKLKAVDHPSTFKCGFCLTMGFGPRYLCGACKLTIHRHCGSQLAVPCKLTCSLHPKSTTDHCMSLQVLQRGAKECHVCGEYMLGYHYSCDAAEDVQVHPICLQLRHAPASIGTSAGRVLTHPAHDDPLKEVFFPKRYRCDGCGSPGMGLRLRCGDCDFNLHPYCFSCPSEQPCFMDHAQHRSRLMPAASPTKRQCHLCCGAIVQTDAVIGMHYLCETSTELAHPLCVQLLQQEKQITSAPTDRAARLLKSVRRVAGRIITRKIELVLIGGIFATGSHFVQQYEATGDMGAAASSTFEHFTSTDVSPPVDVAAAVPPVDVAAGAPFAVPVDPPVVVVDDSTGDVIDWLTSSLDALSNIF